MPIGLAVSPAVLMLLGWNWAESAKMNGEKASSRFWPWFKRQICWWGNERSWQMVDGFLQNVMEMKDV